ncbi:gliding motility-associated ABC transporter substrate-binding protein GldG [Muricauda sp. SCSIO 64092]|uniref:gliding motility-associated ABC transporter substrate-binding protein GldG n=1 Tax=Allomuricauda sp. SCSIO 64092 TaxID=2908842 RepID=UPI001FF5AD54|nr:gliding motility-associated ABC transporter substrate-binding protein GldG [Muricauda sp. SCSIO 64092]UOY06160.1 gliding motility-associated ABC transporter substrate-binding protein GldG [Muricauda sp. SCSIO 64092]
MKGTSIIGGLLIVIMINVISNYAYQRFDLTEDKRFTLSKAALESTSQFDSPVVVDILLEGSLPGEFARLQNETVLLLEQFQSSNKNIVYNLVDPLEDPSTRERTIGDLQRLGLKPANVTIEEGGKMTQELVFPWAMVNYKNKTVKVSLLKNKLGASSEDRVNNSVQNLEYAFADAFKKIGLTQKKKIAVLKGNGELEDRYIADFLTGLKEYYNIGAITLDSTKNHPERVLDQLLGFDLALIAKPTEAFTEVEKYVLDQYIVKGGKSLWLVDQVAMELDSLFNERGSNVAVRRDLNLDDFFFKYGLRINPVLVNDLYNTPIVLANGEANDSQYNPLPWVFHPMIFSKDNHPITNNMEAVRLQFANAIDTLVNANTKTVLLQSSPLSKVEGVPQQIGFDRLNSPLDKEAYPPNPGFPVAVLLEGKFKSAYVNRVKPLTLKDPIENGDSNKMIVIADGDIVKNQLQQGRPLELGYDKWTNSFYGNKEFLVNCVNYLLDDDGFINIRNKNVAIPLLDAEKVVEAKTKWQLLTIGMPILLVVLGSLVQNYLRKRRFAA